MKCSRIVDGWSMQEGLEVVLVDELVRVQDETGKIGVCGRNFWVVTFLFPEARAFEGTRTKQRIEDGDAQRPIVCGKGVVTARGVRLALEFTTAVNISGDRIGGLRIRNRNRGKMRRKGFWSEIFFRTNA